MTTRKVSLSLYLAFLFPVFSRAQPQCPSVCTCVVDLNGDGIIDCSNRGLTEIPPVYIPGASKIAKVDLSRNQLTTLDIDTLYANIAGLIVLELDFSFNSINNMSGWFDAQLGRDFETLNLSSNAFTAFPPNATPVNHYRSKLVIDISHNQLRELTSQMFAGGNDIFIPGFQFFAKGNSISKIADDAFQGVHLVDTVIDLRFNRLATLSPGFESPRGVQCLKLSGNPWHCDCNLRWINGANRFLVNYTALDPPNCVTPPSLLDRPIFSLRAGEFACLPYQQGSLTRNFTNEVNFTLTCPVTADPPNPEISWDMWVPCPDRVTPLHFAFTAETITVSDVETNPKTAFRCTARNNAGSVTFNLDVHYNNEVGIPIPGSHVTMTPLPTIEEKHSTLMTTLGTTQVIRTESTHMSKHLLGSSGTSTLQPEVENKNSVMNSSPSDLSTFNVVSNDAGSNSREDTTTTRVMSSEGEFSQKVPSTIFLSSRLSSTIQQEVTKYDGLVTKKYTEMRKTLSSGLIEESSIMSVTSQLPEVTNTTINSIDRTSLQSKNNVNIENRGKDRNGAAGKNYALLTGIILLSVSVATACIP